MNEKRPGSAWTVIKNSRPSVISASARRTVVMEDKIFKICTQRLFARTEVSRMRTTYLTTVKMFAAGSPNWDNTTKTGEVSYAWVENAPRDQLENCIKAQKSDETTAKVAKSFINLRGAVRIALLENFEMMQSEHLFQDGATKNGARHWTISWRQIQEQTQKSKRKRRNTEAQQKACMERQKKDVPLANAAVRKFSQRVLLLISSLSTVHNTQW